MAEDAYCGLLLRFVVACDVLFIVRQAEVKWKIIAISVCIDYKLISAVCVAHKAELSRTDDFIHFHLVKRKMQRNEIQVVKITQINNK